MKAIMCIIAATLLTACSMVSPHGLFAGVSLEGTGIGTRDDANKAYYGKPVTAGESATEVYGSQWGGNGMSSPLLYAPPMLIPFKPNI